MNLNIYRGSTVWITIKVDDNTRLINQLLGEDIIKSSFNSHIFLDIGIGDFTIYDGVIYHINSLPNIKKNSINSYDYDITFESESYELLKTQFLDSDGNSDFYLVGDLETFIDLIVTNMNREHSDWAKGTCDQTNADYKLLSFSKNNCMQVLQKLCDEFEGEFYFEFALDYEAGAELPYLPAADAVIGYKPAVEAEHGYKPAEFTINTYTKDICFTDKAGTDSGYTFLYKQGLRNIHRTTLSEKNIITRLYAFGSMQNLASDYRDHSRRLIFVSDGESYLEKNTDKYGTIEHTEIFNNTYPHREGTISSVDGGDITKFFDSGMDFNLNDYLLSGVTAKLHFNTGNLGGYEFEVANYNNATKEFTIIAYQDEIGYTLPNATLKPAIGDKYVLLEIKLPQSYIDTAETALQAKAQAYLDDNCEPRVTYILEPDWRYFKTHLIDLEAGDFVTIEDTVLGIDVMTRIVELTKSVANEYKYTLKLTDHLEVQLIQRIYDEQFDLKEKIEIGEGGDIIRSRRNWRTSEELRTMIYDTDGYFDMGNIKPASVLTSMLSVGAKSTQFILKEIEIEGNYQSDVSKFHASAGSLIHLSIADTIRTWTISENTQESLVNETAYYIYAKCTKEPGYTGQVIVDSVQRKFDDDETYYYFLIGVLHSVVDAVRGISLTYGQTIINGRFIRTGKIESTDSSVYFDLDNNTLMLPDGSVTAGKINVDNLAAIEADLGTITAGNITLNTAGYIRSTGKTYGDAVAGFWMGYNVDKYKLHIGTNTEYLKWDGLNLAIAGSITITGGSGIANLTDAGALATLDSIAYAAITGTKPPIDADHTADVVSALAYYNLVSAALLDSTIIVGGYIKTSLLTATNIRAGYLRTVQFRCGGGTDEDIYFEDSGVRMYDAGGRTINIYKSGYKYLQLALGSTAGVLSTDGKLQLSGVGSIELWASSSIFYFYNTGTFRLPALSSAPTPHNGDIAFKSGEANAFRWYASHDSAWHHAWSSSEGW